MQQNSIYVKLFSGWVMVGNHNLSLEKFTLLIHNIKIEGAVYRNWKMKGVKTHRISIYDYATFNRVCKEMVINVVASPMLQLYAKTLQKRLFSKSPEIDLTLWTDNPELQPYDYQRWSIARALAIRNLIIADTLGLGKTNQCIGVIVESMAKFKTTKHIIIVPSKLRIQWMEEILLFTKLTDKEVKILDDPRVNIKKDERERVRRDTIYDANVLLISYNMVKKYTRHLQRQKYQVLVLDEATKIKNNNDQTKSIKELCKSLPANAIKLFVSGTPVENKLEDLYNVFSIIDERVFGYTSEFKLHYTRTDLNGKVNGYKNLNRFKRKIKHFYVRRTSDLVWKDRPELNEKYEVCEMMGGQKKLYKDARTGVLKSLIDLERQSQINNASLAPLMQILLSVTGTCKAIKPEYTGKDHSCKIKVLIELLSDFDKDDKMIVFSRYANKVNPYIRQDLESLTDYKVLEATGKTRNPTEVIKEFRRSPHSILLASDSVSYGQNMQCANYLVNYDLPWNPAVFAQRVGRIYRKGQKQNVNIINLLAHGTFDELVYQKLYTKQNLFNKIFRSDLSSFKVESKLDILKDILYEHTAA